MISYNHFVICITKLMILFYKLSVLWNNPSYLLLSNTNGYELMRYVKLCNSFEQNVSIGGGKVFRLNL